jgi:hypothetical protein
MKERTVYRELIAGVTGFSLTFALVYSNVPYTRAAGVIFPFIIGLVATLWLLVVMFLGRKS